MKELVLNNCRLDRRYDIREPLGRGSYAEIFVARDTLASSQSPHSQVVIKALNVFLQDDLDADLERTLVENFQNEALALDRVRHPNIISRIGHGTARDLSGAVFHYLVLEYLAGGDLQQRVRRQNVPFQQAMNYIEQICSGLAHAHERGIIHRDIKPHNLLLTADHATVKIADFGVARFSIVDSPITRVGTNIYAPPEHSPLSAGRGNDEKLTPAADIYSLAKTVYTLLAHQSPRAFANEPISGLPDDLNGEAWAEDLVRVLRRSTADDPAARHQTVQEFWQDLSALRQIAADGDFDTQIRPVAPQPHVSRGYTPVAPAQPQFEISPETPVLTRPTAPVLAKVPLSTLPVNIRNDATPHTTDASLGLQSRAKAMAQIAPKRRVLRRFAVFAATVALFTGALYGTASYMRGRGVLPDILGAFRSPTGVATTDIYLRPTPNTDNDPIGLVTKNSKVRIVNSQDNWYQVDILEQGRVRPVAANATRGWLNGKYLDLAEN